jgi:ABC-type Fe3+ transport system substrate-binding protein
MRPNDGVVVYGSLGLRRGISDLLWAFRKANRLEEFPAYLDDHPYQVMERIRKELKNRMRTADVVIMPHYAVQTLAGEGLVARYEPEGSSESPPNMRGPGNGATPVGVTFMAMAYDKTRLGPEELPSSLSELAEGTWKGKLGIQSLTASKAGNLGAWYLAFLRRQAGEERWTRFVKSLSKENRPRAYDCIDHLLQGLLEGSVRLALTVYSLAYFREKSSGSPVALVDAARIPHMMTFTSAALVDGSDKSAPARKFMDFLLSSEAQKIIGSIPGIAPVRRGVHASYDFEHRYGPKTEFHPDVADASATKKAVELFRKLGVP